MPPLATTATATTGTASLVVATAYATPVLNGTPLTTPVEPPSTTMWFLLYAQVTQADSSSMRNILLATERGNLAGRTLGDTIDPALKPYFQPVIADVITARDRIAIAVFHQAQIEAMLAAVHLPASASLSLIAVELLPGGTGADVGNPLAGSTVVTTAATTAAVNTGFPFSRILRASPLVPVAPFC